MRKANEIVRDILILKLGDKNTAKAETTRLLDMANGLDSDISGGMLSTHEFFLQCLKKQMFGSEISKPTLAMLNVVFKTHTEVKSISMLGKLLFSEKAVQDDYTLILLYRLLELSGLTIKAIPFGYNALRNGVSENKLADFTEPIKIEIIREYTDSDLIKALFILNDEPDDDISRVNECGALIEYKKVVSEAVGMNGNTLENIPDYTSYPNMVLVMGLRVIAKAGKTIEFQKDTFERFILSILSRQSPNIFYA